MKIAKIIGTVTLNRSLPEFANARLKLAAPMALAEVAENTEPTADQLVVWDELGSGYGQRIAFSDGAEAAQPFRPELKPVDAYTSAILDDINLDQPTIKSIGS